VTDPSPAAVLPTRGSWPFVRRVLATTGVWAALGLSVGISQRPPGGAVAVLAGALAGLIVLTPLGLVCGLLGARPGTTAVGAFSGAALMALAAVASGIGQAGQGAALGLILGAIVGATVSAALRARAWAFSKLFTRPPS
jgi:hypothetical protein